jgi:hypothetical protein
MGIPIIVRHASGNASTIAGVMTHTSNYHLAAMIEELVKDSEFFIRYARHIKKQVCENWCTEKLIREHMLPLVLNMMT